MPLDQYGNNYHDSEGIWQIQKLLENQYCEIYKKPDFRFEMKKEKSHIT
jgi:hypothetical protein